MIGRSAALFGAALSMTTAAPANLSGQSRPSPDFGFYKSRVEPIFLRKKPGYTRCVVCHAASNNNFNLERLSPGATSWTEEQSRRNFEMVLKLVTPGEPSTSRLMMQ